MVSDEMVRNVAKQFLKNELLTICEELGIQVTEDSTSKRMIQMIYQDMLDNGVPEIDSVSDLLGEFLVTAGICDVNGEIILQAEEEAKPEIVQANNQPKALVQPDDVPECFSFQDDMDPACKKCKVLTLCKKTRLAHRPKCFGKLYSQHDEQCKVCLEALYCNAATEQEQSTSKHLIYKHKEN